MTEEGYDSSDRRRSLFSIFYPRKSRDHTHISFLRQINSNPCLICLLSCLSPRQIGDKNLSPADTIQLSSKVFTCSSSVIGHSNKISSWTTQISLAPVLFKGPKSFANANLVMSALSPWIGWFSISLSSGLDSWDQSRRRPAKGRLYLIPFCHCRRMAAWNCLMPE